MSEIEKDLNEMIRAPIRTAADAERVAHAAEALAELMRAAEKARGALLKVLDKPHLDLTTPIGRGFIAFLSALAEDERQRIVKRANDGRAAARKRGADCGRRNERGFMRGARGAPSARLRRARPVRGRS